MEEVNKTIIILGFARTGSSLTANICKELGVDLGNNLRSADRFNQCGYFENNDFVDLNAEILGGKYNWQNYTYEKIMSKKEQYKDKIKKLIKQYETNLWGWKHGITLLTIDLYLPYLKNPHFIICNRNPQSTMKSMIRQSGKDLDFELYYFYDKELKKFIHKKSKYPILFLSFEDYFTNPREQVEKIRKFLGVEKDIDYNKIIDKNLKHF